jgi:hypothetical protein
MRQAILILMTMALALPAQEAPKPEAPARQPGVRHVQRVYQVQHVDVDELYRLVYTSPGQNQTPVLRSSAALRAITVYGTQSEVDTIMASLKTLDVPGRAAPVAGRNTFELTSYILLAAAEGEVEGAPLPDALKGVAAELERTFGLRQIRMLEAGVLRVGPRMSNELSGSLGSIGKYTLAVRDASVEGSLARARNDPARSRLRRRQASEHQQQRRPGAGQAGRGRQVEPGRHEAISDPGALGAAGLTPAARRRPLQSPRRA